MSGICVSSCCKCALAEEITQAAKKQKNGKLGAVFGMRVCVMFAPFLTE